MSRGVRAGTSLRLLSLVAGLAMMAFAAWFALHRRIEVRPGQWVRWWVGAAVVHDLVVAPLALAVGWLVVRVVPRAAKAPVQVGLLLSAVLVAVSWPSLRGYGRLPDNRTILPRSYTTGLAVALVVVWAACALWTVVRAVRHRPA